ncbi:hypothetical protein CWI38_1496p0010 [Hamiltosporidium tvaerminnensis]|uniref:Uncharacterized protein n=1 Tax=Hamiltosporidium tvaerminnensis TaxID=1176355 RepID=A0A4V6MVK8_9MICR|nr:hypothetical protein CWI37_0071p0030 [Hamiltosporidium tvaerminnensis]TBU10882.1 hypothetical protein CWI38_1496p0010 [Hamiltosporidium tvaerminnensis]
MMKVKELIQLWENRIQVNKANDKTEYMFSEESSVFIAESNKRSDGLEIKTIDIVFEENHEKIDIDKSTTENLIENTPIQNTRQYSQQDVLDLINEMVIKIKNTRIELTIPEENYKKTKYKKRFKNRGYSGSHYTMIGIKWATL